MFKLPYIPAILIFQALTHVKDIELRLNGIIKSKRKQQGLPLSIEGQVNHLIQVCNLILILIIKNNNRHFMLNIVTVVSAIVTV